MEMIHSFFPENEIFPLEKWKFSIFSGNGHFFPKETRWPFSKMTKIGIFGIFKEVKMSSLLTSKKMGQGGYIATN